MNHPINNMVTGRAVGSNTKDINSAFASLIQGTELEKSGYIVLNIFYTTKKTKKLETKCMLFDVKQISSFLHFLGLRLNSLADPAPYNIIRAGVKKILIQDEEDLIGAIVQHVKSEKTNGAMPVYLSND